MKRLRISIFVIVLASVTIVIGLMLAQKLAMPSSNEENNSSLSGIDLTIEKAKDSTAQEKPHLFEPISGLFEKSPGQGMTTRQMDLLCAVNCLYLVNRHYNVNMPYSDLLFALNPTNIGVSMSKLKEVAEQIGYNVEAFQISSREIVQHHDPMIALLFKDGYESKIGHFVVLIPISERNGFWLVDALAKNPKTWITQEELKDRRIHVLLLKPQSKS